MTALAPVKAFAAQIPSVVGTVFANRDLRRVELAFAGFHSAEWAVWIAMSVYAYDRGGATTAGIVAVVQLAPAAIFAPFGASLADRHRAGRVLFGGYVAQSAGMAATAAVLLNDGSPYLAYAFAAFATTSQTITRPTQTALLPALSRRPRELTAANVVAGWVESLSILVAPAVAGLVLNLAGPGWVFALMACVVALSALLVLPVPGPPPAGVGEDSPGILRQTAQSLHVLRSEPAGRALVLLLTAEAVAIGALDILYAELAIGELGLSEGWTGYLNAALGLGGVLAIAVTATLVGRRRLAPPLVVGMVLWFAALVLLGIRPTVLSALVLLAVCGVGHVVMDVSARTLLQRLAPAHVLARVFGLLESLQTFGLVIGSLLAPLFIAIGGARLALVVVGVFLPLAALALGRGLRHVDRDADVPVVEIGLLRSLPLFCAMPAPELEGVARSLIPVEVGEGEAVIVQGEVGDRFFVVAEGRIEARENGRLVNTLTRGDGFGEIALLHDVRRTASCTAVEPARLYALERDDFLVAVTGHVRATDEAHRLADRRIADLEASVLSQGDPRERFSHDAVGDQRSDVGGADRHGNHLDDIHADHVESRGDLAAGPEEVA